MNPVLLNVAFGQRVLSQQQNNTRPPMKMLSDKNCHKLAVDDQYTSRKKVTDIIKHWWSSITFVVPLDGNTFFLDRYILFFSFYLVFY